MGYRTFVQQKMGLEKKRLRTTVLVDSPIRWPKTKQILELATRKASSCRKRLKSSIVLSRQKDKNTKRQKYNFLLPSFLSQWQQETLEINFYRSILNFLCRQT